MAVQSFVFLENPPTFIPHSKRQKLTEMKATFNPTAKTKFTTSHRKENKCYFEQFSAIVKSEYGREAYAVVDLRLYGTGSSWYACIWVNSKAANIHTNGSGSAGGYGYHKPSAAAAEAIKNAGFTLSENISGVGDSAIFEAVQAIATAAGYPDALIFKAHQ